MRTKRPADAVKAFALVRHEFPGATLDIIGDGYLRESLRDRRDPGVLVHGFVPESVKSTMLARADLMLVPGTREGWGIVAIEAGLRRIPVVAYRLPGLRDAVQDGVTGVLTSPNPEAMGEAAVALLRDPDRWAKLSEGSRRQSEALTWPRSAAGLLKWLQPGNGLGHSELDRGPTPGHMAGADAPTLVASRRAAL